MKAPRVLVGCPTYAGKDYVLERYAARVRELDYPNYDILLVDNSDDGGAYQKRIERLGLPCIAGPKRKRADVRLAASRNVLRERAVRGGYDYYFSLEQDVVPPRDVLARLVSHRKRVVSGWYFNSVPVVSSSGALPPTRYLKEPCVVVKLPEKPLSARAAWKAKERLEHALCHEALLRVDVGALGVCLLETRVLEEVPFHHDPNRENYDDIVFYRLLKLRKIRAYVDTDLLVPHFQNAAR